MLDVAWVAMCLHCHVKPVLLLTVTSRSICAILSTGVEEESEEEMERSEEEMEGSEEEMEGSEEEMVGLVGGEKMVHVCV